MRPDEIFPCITSQQGIIQISSQSSIHGSFFGRQRVLCGWTPYTVISSAQFVMMKCSQPMVGLTLPAIALHVFFHKSRRKFPTPAVSGSNCSTPSSISTSPFPSTTDHEISPHRNQQAAPPPEHKEHLPVLSGLYAQAFPPMILAALQPSPWE